MLTIKVLQRKTNLSGPLVSNRGILVFWQCRKAKEGAIWWRFFRNTGWNYYSLTRQYVSCINQAFYPEQINDDGWQTLSWIMAHIGIFQDTIMAWTLIWLIWISGGSLWGIHTQCLGPGILVRWHDQCGELMLIQQVHPAHALWYRVIFSSVAYS